MAKVIGIDYGTKNMGLAVSDELEMVAKRGPILNVKDIDDALSKLSDFIEKNGVKEILIGMPLDEDGNLTNTAREVRAFSERLKLAIDDLKIVEWNETFSSGIAKLESVNKKWLKKHEDSEVARMLLQEYLDYKNTNSKN